MAAEGLHFPRRLNRSTIFANLELILEMTAETKLPVLRTVVDAYGFVFRNIKPFFALAAIPIALTIGISFVRLVRLGRSPAMILAVPEIDGWYYLENFAFNFIWCVFAVSWHRYVLLGRRDTASPLQFHIGRRELRFFLYSLIFLVPLTVLRSSFSFGFWAAGIIISVVWVRCLLIFPAVAVDGYEGLAVAWTQLRGATWRLLFAGSIAYIPLLILGYIIFFLYGVPDGSAPSHSQNSWELNVTLAIGHRISSFLFAAVAVTVLSLAFRYKTKWVPRASP